MKKGTKKLHHAVSTTDNRWKLLLKRFLFTLLILSSSSVFAQKTHTIRGLVVDDKQIPVIGATVIIKGTTKGVITDATGQFSIDIPSDNQVLIVSFVGMQPQELDVTDKVFINVAMKESVVSLNEVVVVGYGKQKKESVVGAISQTSGAVLERAGGVTNIGAALTGNIPGLITIQGTGEPGDENPVIYIRGQGTWNYSSPLVLIDGIERSMNEIDFKSVESISVLKDASATAVFGVKGANGVILITTKRGSEGKLSIKVSSDMTVKIPSMIPGVYDSYDALKVRNLAVEREVNITPSVFPYYTPLPELNKYRNPSSPEEAERFPNINWQKESFKDHALSYNSNISISGGSSFVKYFTSMDYLQEGDLMKVRNNGQGYSPGYGYRRLNFRSNLDFNLTRTTTLTTNLSGSHGVKKETWSGFEYTMWQAAYSNPPDAFPVQYSDGTWGYWPANTVDVQNSVKNVSSSGIRNVKKTIINTDFTLAQDLAMLVTGLSAKATFSLDNMFMSDGGVWTNYGTLIEKWIAPDGSVTWGQNYGTAKYDYVTPPWSVRSDTLYNDSTFRKTFYQVQLNYETKINNHNITAMGLFSRDQRAKGSIFPMYREDWVFRTTYNYAERYFAEFNGAYNGSEKFGPSYRFDFFPSAALGWMVSNERFMKHLPWLDRFKIRGSYGLVGNDRISYDEYDPNYRWLYTTEWKTGGQALLGRTSSATSPYTWYKEGTIGNPKIHWETAVKENIGIEYSFLNNLIEGSVDIFSDYRKEILIQGDKRAVPSYFGGTAPAANLGEVKVKGYEIETKLNYRFTMGLRLWANMSMTHSKDEIIFADDAELLPAYQKTKGYQINQYRSQLISDHVNTWDEVYGSTQWQTNDNLKLPGEFNLVDFNGDGVIDNLDNAPNGYPDRPQNTYNWTIGFDYKGFSFFAQFYGVSNVTRVVYLSNFNKQTDIVHEQGDYWSKDNIYAKSFVPRFLNKFDMYGNFYAYDGSYLRLKNTELAYTFESRVINKIGMKSVRIFVNGNNLLLWTKMPDDRESNLGGSGGGGAYPTVRRINFGVNIVL
jgi:TonB-linked SusC/RagA family outer membrane protein